MAPVTKHIDFNVGASVEVDDADEVVVVKTAIVEDDGVVAGDQTIDVIDDGFDPADRLPPHAVKNDDGSVALPLLYPRSLTIKKDGKVREQLYDKLLMHRLTGADQRAIAATSDDTMPVVAIARSTRISQAVMNVLYDKLDAADIAAAGQVLNHFLASGRMTGRR